MGEREGEGGFDDSCSWFLRMVMVMSVLLLLKMKPKRRFMNYI